MLEVLRQPLEEKKIVVSRARYSVEYPANFTLVAAMNPCPCGYYNHPDPGVHLLAECGVPLHGPHFGPAARPHRPPDRGYARVAGRGLKAAPAGEPSAAIRERVVRARAVQAARFRDAEGCTPTP